ncbi:MAG: hypothetical protein WBC62_07790 [Candidatus Macondimonas sp.]
MNEHDQYPSRNGSLPTMLERLDPVVYARDLIDPPLSRKGRDHDRGAKLFDHLDQRIGIELLTK